MFRILTIGLLLLGIGAGQASASTIKTEHVRADLSVRNAVTQPGESTDIAIRTSLADGWHTYWLNPGDSGEPPIISFDLPAGATAQKERFPTPHKLPYPPLMTYGYKDDFTLLTAIKVPEDWPAGTPMRVPVRIDWLVCEAICIPEGGTTEIVIETGPDTEPDSTVAFTFVQAEWALPEESNAAATYSRGGDIIYLSVPLGEADDATFFPLARGVIDNTAEQTAVAAADGNGMTLALATGNTPLDGILRGVLKTGSKAYWITAEGDPDDVPVSVAAAPVTPVAAPPSLPPSATASFGAAFSSEAGVLRAVLFAFLGGLILNLMPCVFPVLALKALGLVSHADAPFGRRVVIGLAYTSGILTSFAILAGVLLSLKAAGVAVGWGFQLQSPVFVAVVAAVIFLVGLNLSGVFEVGLGLTRLGGTGPQDGVAGSFATGVLATVVATPCSAPFMAVAIGTALMASTPVALMVFAAMGLGLALPFVLLALLPGLARIMPKPGVWMVRLKQVLAFPLYATVAWLIWVAAQLVGVDALLGLLMALVLVGFAAYLFGLSQRGAGRSHKVASGLAVASIAAAFFVAWPAATGQAPVGVSAAVAGASEPYSPGRLQSLEAQGRPVFLNVTAAWCISCKVNERVVFDSAGFQSLIGESGITYMTADWTRRDPDVTSLMERFGRAGVPLYVYFPQGRAPEILPQILTLSMLETAFSEE